MKDYIIVGLGLAGLSIAHELEKQNKTFLIFDTPSSSASKIAGGVINPLILKRFTKAWKADEFIPTATSFYQSLEKELAQSFFQQFPIYRKIKSVREQNDWFVAADKPDLKLFMEAKLQRLESLPSPFHYGKVKHTGFVNTEKLLIAYQKKLEAEGKLITTHFDYSQLIIGDDEITYQKYHAQKIIFCEGANLLQNPFFKWLPLIGNKGEYLIVKIPSLTLNVILKTAIALIPLGNQLYKFGATYSREYTTNLPEAEARRFLLQKLEEIIDCPYTIIETQVGIRPTVLDRRPLLGQHPQHKNVLVYNGLGSHGVMMAPTLAQWLLNYDLKQQDLPKEVNIKRYFKNLTNPI